MQEFLCGRIFKPHDPFCTNILALEDLYQDSICQGARKSNLCFSSAGTYCKKLLK